ncbi:MAG TPA: glycosyltransferase family 4 protein [Intrasporangium sp.]|uniref:glycosyltransferase family 4 protein n=1 Tax=Intrasporangium sp. TaxID=1925024 RepID=UPI002B46B6EF|nr:glycosyltransferase family 4 protein [Intrasporangium sp.]HKX68707.1 glycosyltransferase family 4 protein [Intrasporangium sp.]
MSDVSPDGTPQEVPPLRVLLISPLPALDPPSGDVTYTQQLLGAPPPGVSYTTYDQALRDGRLVELGTRAAVRQASGVDRVSQCLIAMARKSEHLLRRSGLAFREQIRVFRVRANEFDLVHVHVFHHRFLGSHPPVVASAGGPLRWVYADAWGWSEYRLRVAETFDRLIALPWDATMCASRPGRVDLFISPSEYLRRWLIGRGWQATRIAVQRNYLAGAGGPPRSRLRRSPRTLGFVARDFDAKGGHDVLAAYEQLRSRHPGLLLRIVGSPPRLSPNELTEAAVEWTNEVDRDQLLAELLPEIDVLVYPSHFDTGVPYSAMEALAQGIPGVVSDYGTLPDLVDGDAGRVSAVGDVTSIVRAVEDLLNPATWRDASEAASRRFRHTFASGSQSPRLGALYRAAIESKQGRSPAAPDGSTTGARG